MRSTQLRLRLEAIEYGAPDINIYRFASCDGAVLPGATPGAHVDVRINDSFTRSYSLINSGSTLLSYEIGVRRDVVGRGGSLALHQESVVGEVYEVSPPRNNFELKRDDGPVVLLAGGIGITPMISMYRELKQAGEEVHLYYWARSEDAFLFREELDSDSDATLFVAEAAPAPGQDVATVVAKTSEDSHLYCCGPGPMLDDFLRQCEARSHERVHIERFAPVAVLPVEAGEAGDYTVELAKTGMEFEVHAESTILATLLDAGVDVDYSCEEGTCGACEVKVLVGEILHRDSVRTPEEHDDMQTMMICSSRPRGDRVVIDV